MKKRKWFKRTLILLGIALLVAAGSIAGVMAYGKYRLSEKAAAITADCTTTMVAEGQEYLWRKDVFNIVCIGVDREEDMGWQYADGRSIGQADAIFVLSIDLEENEIRMIAIPRDTMVELRMYNNAYGFYSGKMQGQIALQYAYADGGWQSCSQVEHRVSELLGGAPMHGYVAVNLTSIEAINDAVGGVDVTMDNDYTWINPSFEKGAVVHLWGRDARDFIQRRDTEVYGSAMTRIARAKLYLKSFIRQAKSAVIKDIELPAHLADELSAHLTTSYSEEEITYIAMQAVISEISVDEMYTIPGEIKMGEVYEEYYPDEEAVQEMVIELFCEK